MNKVFTENGWKDYVYWQTEDRKTLKKINQLIDDISCIIVKGSPILIISFVISKSNVKLRGLVFITVFFIFR